ncbi:CDKN2AIPNL [Cervus elaphus hippelaphus]|nr:CDKN2AIPNL [Cervus elaphus hippelaphus]
MSGLASNMPFSISRHCLTFPPQAVLIPLPFGRPVTTPDMACGHEPCEPGPGELSEPQPMQTSYSDQTTGQGLLPEVLKLCPLTNPPAQSRAARAPLAAERWRSARREGGGRVQPLAVEGAMVGGEAAAAVEELISGVRRATDFAEQFRSYSESEKQWKARMEFILRHLPDYRDPPDGGGRLDQLLSLSMVWANHLFLGCSYNKDLLDKVMEMADGIEVEDLPQFTTRSELMKKHQS